MCVCVCVFWNWWKHLSRGEEMRGESFGEFGKIVVRNLPSGMLMPQGLTGTNFCGNREQILQRKHLDNMTRYLDRMDVSRLV